MWNWIFINLNRPFCTAQCCHACWANSWRLTMQIDLGQRASLIIIRQILLTYGQSVPFKPEFSMPGRYICWCSALYWGLQHLAVLIPFACLRVMNISAYFVKEEHLRIPFMWTELYCGFRYYCIFVKRVEKIVRIKRSYILFFVWHLFIIIIPIIIMLPLLFTL